MSDDRRARTAAKGIGDGPVSGLYQQYLTRQNVAMNHGLAEGFVPEPSAVLRGYDKNEHPLMHGRRAHDIIRGFREVFGRGQ